jgi:hypothetical protein
MKAEGLSTASIAAFQYSYAELLTGSAGNIPEASISPATSIPSLERDIHGVILKDTSLPWA